MATMHLVEAFWKQIVHRQMEELVPVVPKQLLGLAIDDKDRPAVVSEKDAVRRGVDDCPHAEPSSCSGSTGQPLAPNTPWGSSRSGIGTVVLHGVVGATRLAASPAEGLPLHRDGYPILMKTEEMMDGTLESPGALVEVEYLDLDGDGVPDAVQTIEAVAIDLTGDGVCDAVELVEEVAAHIGIDGVPEQVVNIEDVAVSFD